MGPSRTIILNCSADRTALAVFRRQAGRLRLEQYAGHTLAPDDSGKGGWFERTREALQSLRTRVKAGGPVVLVLPAHAVLTKLSRIPRVGPAQREKILHFEAVQNIPYALADVVWDSIVMSENMGELEVLLAAAKLDLVEPLSLAAEAAGFPPQAVMPSFLGLLAGFRLAQADRAGSSLLLNLQARSATLLLVESGRFACRNFGLGGGLATQPAAETPADEVGEAELPGNSAGSAGLPPDAPDVRGARLLQEITRSLLHFHLQGRWQDPERVFLAGEGSESPDLAGILAAKLKVPVEHLKLPAAVEIATDVRGKVAVEQEHLLTDLIGAAAVQLCPDQPVLDLLPPRRRQLRRRRERQPWLVAAAVLLVLALALPLIHFRNVRNAAREKTASLERELVPLRSRVARNRTKLQRLGELQRQIAGLQSVYDRRASWLGLLADLQERLGSVKDVWLDRLQVTFEATDPALRLAVSGRMLDKANPLAKVSPETFSRVKTLLASIADSPFVGSVGPARFDSSQPGILRFDFIIIAGPERRL